MTTKEDFMTAKEDTGSVAVVTGGARGIGLGCAMALAAKGFNLALVDVLEAELKRRLVNFVRQASGLSPSLPTSATLKKLRK